MIVDFTVCRQAYNLYLEGHGYKATAKLLGLHESTVRIGIVGLKPTPMICF